MVSLQAVVAILALSAPRQALLLDFYSDQCPPCLRMDPVVKDLIAQGYPIRQVNVKQDRALAQRFRVHTIPCFVMTVGGREVEGVERAVGLTSAERLIEMCRAGMSRAAGNATAGIAGPLVPPVVSLSEVERRQGSPPSVRPASAVASEPVRQGFPDWRAEAAALAPPARAAARPQ